MTPVFFDYAREDPAPHREPTIPSPVFAAGRRAVRRRPGHDLLAEVVQGRSNEEIARALGLRQKTVRNHVSTVMAKLRARNRAHLVVIARDAGYPET